MATRSAAAEPAPIFGRQAELARLREVVAAVTDGTGARFVLMVGETGVGKTRLAEEVLAAARGATVLTGRASPPHAGLAYAPVIGALGPLVRAAGRTTPSPTCRTSRGCGRRSVRGPPTAIRSLTAR